jgi:hypothetical protein
MRTDGGRRSAVQVITPVVVFTAEYVTTWVATVPSPQAGGPVNLNVPEAPMRRTISAAVFTSVVIDVAPLAAAAPVSPSTLLAYLLVAVIRPISVPAHSSQVYGAFSGLLELVPSIVTGGAQNCANSRPE